MLQKSAPAAYLTMQSGSHKPSLHPNVRMLSKYNIFNGLDVQI